MSTVLSSTCTGTSSNDLQTIRERVQSFVNERRWSQFHTPKNLLLALSGEVGELCEIFQWVPDESTSFDGSFAVPEKDLIHLGEELSDVFIYTLRMAEICRIDLGLAVSAKLATHAGETQQGSSKPSNLNAPDTKAPNPSSPQFVFEDAKRCRSESEEWTCVNFTNAMDIFNFKDIAEPSTRNYSMKIQVALGAISALFYNKVESACDVGLTTWSVKEVNQLAIELGKIIVLVLQIAKKNRFNMKDTLLSKIKKNELKYPSHLAQGSAAKYTAYSGKLVSSSSSSSSFSSSLSSSPFLSNNIYLGCMFALILGFAMKNN